MNKSLSHKNKKQQQQKQQQQHQILNHNNTNRNSKMKFSTTFTLATSALLSIGTHARTVCDTGAEHSKIYDQLQARYNDNCVQTDNSSQGDIDMEWYCIKTYGNGIIDAVTYRAYDPTGKEFVPFSWETEGGDPNSMLSTAKTYNLFKDP